MVVYGGFGGQNEQVFFKDTWVWDTRAETPQWHSLDGQWKAGGADGTLRATHTTAATYDGQNDLCTLVSFAGVTYSGRQQLYDHSAITLNLKPNQVRKWIDGKENFLDSQGWSTVTAEGPLP